VRDAYYRLAATNGPADLWLMLGDNAYEDGSLAQYNAEYKPYWGRQDGKVYPAPGNHEFQSRISFP
jgi:hypothetical protein